MILIHECNLIMKISRILVANLSIVWSAILAMALPHAYGSNEVPGSPQKQPIALVGGTVHTVSGETIEKGMVLFEQGKITAIGNQLVLPDGTEQIAIDGKHVYPALIDAFTQLGLVEIESVRATIDYRETGLFNPNVKSWVAVNPDSEIIPVTRANGVLLVLAAPDGGLISGRSAVLQLDGWTYEDMVLRSDVAMHVNWPSSSSRESSLLALREFLERARAYIEARDAEPQRQPMDLRLEAMRPVLDGKLPLMVSADEMRHIQAAVAFSVEERVRLVIHGGYDAVECAELLKLHQIPVIVAGTYRLPLRSDDSYDAAYSLPSRLREAGVTYCLASGGRFSATGVRNLPYHAATAAGFGLPVEEALRAITLYPAEVLGIADRVGSLEVGKDATLFVCSGDPLDVNCSVVQAYIQGRKVELNDRHKRLWKKYEQKYLTE
jgi:imidazolonepropionase-like amidohydrolase